MSNRQIDVHRGNGGAGNYPPPAASMPPSPRIDNKLLLELVEREIELVEREMRSRLEALMQQRNSLMVFQAKHEPAPRAPSPPQQQQRQQQQQRRRQAISRGGMTVADGVAEILRNTGEMHISSLRDELMRQFQIEVTRKNLANILNRWLKRGTKFRRSKASTYALLEKAH